MRIIAAAVSLCSADVEVDPISCRTAVAAPGLDNGELMGNIGIVCRAVERASRLFVP